MKKKKALIIGCGKFFQTVHLKNILKFYKVEILLDPRPKLLEKILKNNKSIKRFTNFNSLFNYKKKFDTIFNISSRISSYKILRKLIPISRTVFSEKPGVFNLNQARKINKISSKFKTKVLFGYMSRYDKNVLLLKSILKEKKLENLKKSFFFISNNNIYPTQKKHFNSLEKKDFSFAKAYFPKHLKTKHKSHYQIFINRYSHLINLMNFLIPVLNVKNFKIIDKYNYSASFVAKNNKEIKSNFKNKGNYLIHIYFEFVDSYIDLKLYNPLQKKKSKLSIEYKNTYKKLIYESYTDIFLEEIKSTYSKKNEVYNSKVEDLLKEFKLINDLWTRI